MKTIAGVKVIEFAPGLYHIVHYWGRGWTVWTEKQIKAASAVVEVIG